MSITTLLDQQSEFPATAAVNKLVKQQQQQQSSSSSTKASSNSISSTLNMAEVLTASEYENVLVRFPTIEWMDGDSNDDFLWFPPPSTTSTTTTTTMEESPRPRKQPRRPSLVRSKSIMSSILVEMGGSNKKRRKLGTSTPHPRFLSLSPSSVGGLQCLTTVGVFKQ